jgi:cyclopropane-fatty-acyl-phospholipid synthase
LKDGSTVLDMGCGWGSFTLFAAERFPKLKFTAVSNSPTQREYIMGKAAAKGMRNVEVKTMDLGKEANLESLCGELKGSFSRIISIEMLEHMKRYDKIFEYASRLLKPGAGKMLVHVFCNDRWVGVHVRNVPWQICTHACAQTCARARTHTHSIALV